MSQSQRYSSYILNLKFAKEEKRQRRHCPKLILKCLTYQYTRNPRSRTYQMKIAILSSTMSNSKEYSSPIDILDMSILKTIDEKRICVSRRKV